MTIKEKISYGLRCLGGEELSCEQCAYKKSCVLWPSSREMANDIQQLLKDMNLKFGHWDNLPLADWPYVCRCSACKDRSDGHTLFCPNCGAYMTDTHEALERDGHIAVRAYEPARLLSKDDVLTGSGGCWIEDWVIPEDNEPDVILLQKAAFCKGQIIYDNGSTATPLSVEEFYNKRYGFRMWTSKPTDEARKAAEWDD